MNLNPEQRRAVEHPADATLRVVAGAGTGKTTVLVARYVHLVDACGIPPERILAMTFTVKAAQEMRARIHRELRARGGEAVDALRGAWIMNFHQFALRLLRDEAPAAGIDPGVDVMTIAEEQAVRRLLRARFLSGTLEGMATGFEDEDVSPGGLERLVEACLEGVVLCRAAGIDPRSTIRGDEPEWWQRRVRTVGAMIDAWERELRRRGLVDFTGMMRRGVALLGDEAIRRRWSRRFDAVLVDEYQDTSDLQTELLRRLRGDALRGVTVVGDEKQSIYRWRGARVENMRALPGRIERLTRNYRSRGPILAVADAFVRVAEEFADEPGLIAQRGEDGPPVVIAWPRREPGAPKARKDACDRGAQAEVVVDWILAITGRRRDARFAAAERPLEWHDVTVLMRKLGASGGRADLEAAMQRAGVPYAVVGGANGAEFDALDTVHAWLSLLTPEPDVLRVVSVLERAPVSLPDAHLMALMRVERGAPPPADILAADRIEAIADPAAAQRVREVVRWRDAMRERLVVEPFDVFLETAIESGLGAVVRAAVAGMAGESDGGPAPADRAADEIVAQLRALAATLADRHALSCEAFLEALRGLVDAGTLRREGEVARPHGRVRIMTIHQAKGLEFPAVAVVGVDDSRPAADRVRLGPDGRLYFEGDLARAEGLHVKDALDEEERRMLALEERCVYYVALTRARDALLVTSSRARPEGTLFADLLEATASLSCVRRVRVSTDPDVRAAEAAVRDRAADAAPSHAGGPDGPRDGPARERAATDLDVQLAARASADRRATRFDRRPLEPVHVTWPQVAAFARCAWMAAWELTGTPSPPAGDAGAGTDPGAPPDERIDGVVPPEPPPAGVDPADWGRAAHAAFEAALRDPGADAAAVADGALEALDLSRARRTEARAAIAGLVEALRASPLGRAGEDAAFEEPFTARRGPLVLGGVFDRVERREGRWRVIDYKVGDAHAAYRWQVGLYAHVLSLARGGPVTGHLAFVRPGGVTVVDVGATDVEAAARAFAGLADAVGRGSFDPSPGAVCAACAWRSMCVHAAGAAPAAPTSRR